MLFKDISEHTKILSNNLQIAGFALTLPLCTNYLKVLLGEEISAKANIHISILLFLLGLFFIFLSWYIIYREETNDS